jgi:septum formation protein|tara:strand:+ start:2542 stop:3201 length:660 start_codon:yes stop_codon:yes gene_type:complete
MINKKLNNDFIVLASSSARRIKIMEDIGWDFVNISPDIDETMLEGENAKDLVSRLSYNKAFEVSKKFSAGIVIAADSIVEVDSEVFGKPETSEQATYMLTTIRSKEHNIITGVTVMDANTGCFKSDHSEIKVLGRRFTDQEIQDSISVGTPFDKAGGYAIQDKVLSPVALIEGCYLGALGLPTCTVTRLIKDLFGKIPAGCFSPEKFCKPHCKLEAGAL